MRQGGGSCLGLPSQHATIPFGWHSLGASRALDTLALYFIHQRLHHLHLRRPYPFYHALFTRPRAHERLRRSLRILGQTARAREGIAAERPIHECFRGSLFTPLDIYLFLKWTLSARACPPTYELIYCSPTHFSHPLFACLDYALYLRRGRRRGWV